MYIDKKLIEAYENLQNVSQQKIKDLSDELISVKAKMKNLIGNVSKDVDNILKKIFCRRK